MRKRTAIIAGAFAVASIGAGGLLARRRRLCHRCEEYSYPSLFGDAEAFTMETDDGTPVRVLYVGGGFQSATYLGCDRFKPVFEYYRAFDHMFEAAFDIKRVAMLGGGGFSYPKHLLTSRDDVSIDVVELDGTIVDIARRHFFVDELEAAHGEGGSGRLGIYVQDGLEFLREADDTSYDVIINDSFDGANPTVGLLTSSALARAKRVLRPGGLYMLNAVVGDGDDHVLKTFMEVVSEGFDNVYAISCIDEEFAGEENWLIIGTDESYVFSGVEAMMSR